MGPIAGRPRVDTVRHPGAICRRRPVGGGPCLLIEAGWIVDGRESSTGNQSDVSTCDELSPETWAGPLTAGQWYNRIVKNPTLLVIAFLAWPAFQAPAADPEKLRAAFAYHPVYYHFGVEATNYFDLGPQNSRGFRALKVWLALQEVGREGYEQMISDDIRLARALFERIPQYAEIEALTQSLSITTFRFVPTDLDSGDETVASYLDELNLELLTRLQAGGEAYLSNAVVHGKFALRACIVNFRTSLADIEALLPIVVRMGKALDLDTADYSTHRHREAHKAAGDRATRGVMPNCRPSRPSDAGNTPPRPK